MWKLQPNHVLDFGPDMTCISSRSLLCPRCNTKTIMITATPLGKLVQLINLQSVGGNSCRHRENIQPLLIKRPSPPAGPNPEPNIQKQQWCKRCALCTTMQQFIVELQQRLLSDLGDAVYCFSMKLREADLLKQRVEMRRFKGLKHHSL